MQQQEIDSLISKFSNLDSSLITAIALDCASVEEAETMLEPLNIESAAADQVYEDSTDFHSHDGTDSTGNTTALTSVDDYKEAQRLQLIENYHGDHDRMRQEETQTQSLRREIEDTDLDLDTYMTIRKMFPHVPAIKIKLRMKKFRDASVEDLLEYFLNYDTLKEVAPEQFGASVEVLSMVTNNKRKLRSRAQGDSNRVKRGAALVQLTPLRRVPYWDDNDDYDDPGDSQCWKMFNGDIERIASLLDLPKQKVAKYYYASNVSIAKTIIAILAEAHTDEMTDEDREYVYASTERFKNVPFVYLERLYLFTNRDEAKYSEVAGIIAAYDDKWNDMFSFRFGGGETTESRPIAEATSAHVVTHQTPTSTGNEKVKIALTAPAPRVEEEEFRGPITDAEGYQQVSGRRSARLKTVSELQELAQRLEETRKSYLYKSTTNPTLRGYYRGAIAELEEKRRQASTEARLLQQRRSESAHFTDLHGLTVNEALTLVTDKIDVWWGIEHINAEKQAPVRMLHIVTGAGNHSHNGVPKIKNALSMWLKSHGWSFHSNTASVDVIGRRSTRA
ncbi:Smr domain-containing protein [Yarrowia sp. C11]|nr:Smr domain-containing protein [Yarrowia sp. E02]KAG5371429.1 Smr domain-containing protein [Yarrowia sp. C11]